MRIILFFILFYSLSFVGVSQIFVPSSTSVIDGRTMFYNSGDTIFMEGGIRNRITIKNFNDVFVINKDSVVHIISNQTIGIKVINCNNIRILGSGTSNFYGFVIESNDIAIQFTDTTSDIEISRCELRNSNLGILGKSSLTRNEFTQFNTHIHDNYIHHMGTEGIYIGSSFYATSSEHLLNGVAIYNNIIDSTGWDGIQVGSATLNCAVYNNHITHDSYKRQSSQMSGIMLNPGSKCDCFNNWIENGEGSGIFDQGLGENNLYNNIIINAGVGGNPNRPRGDDGISIWGLNRPYSAGNSIYVFHNTIINPMNNGITFAYDDTIQGHSSKIFNNLIVSPNGTYWSFDTSRTYIEPSFGAPFLDTGNYFLGILDTSFFVDVVLHDFHLKPSVVTGTGVDLGFYQSTYDFDSLIRNGLRSPGAYHIDLPTLHIPKQNLENYFLLKDNKIVFSKYVGDPISIYTVNGKEIYKGVIKEEVLLPYETGIYFVSLPKIGKGFKVFSYPF